MAMLLDTNVLSELRRRKPEARVTAFVSERPLSEFYVSTVSLAEIRFGIVTVADPILRTQLEDWLKDIVRPMFVGRILEITEDVMLRWRLLADRGQRMGRTFSQPDLIIAATALEHGLSMVTRNVRDFEGVGLALINTWD